MRYLIYITSWFVSTELTDPVMKEHKFYIKLIINYILFIFVIKIH